MKQHNNNPQLGALYTLIVNDNNNYIKLRDVTFFLSTLRKQ